MRAVSRITTVACRLRNDAESSEVAITASICRISQRVNRL